MQEYPIKDRIREVLIDRNLKLPWLLGVLDKSESWFHKLQSIEELQLKTLLALSDNVKFDFVLDYYGWVKRPTALPSDNEVNEPQVEYTKKRNKGIVQITFTGSAEDIADRFYQMAEKLK